MLVVIIVEANEVKPYHPYIRQAPLPRDGKDLDFSRWQQNLLGSLSADILYSEEGPAGEYFDNVLM